MKVLVIALKQGAKKIHTDYVAIRQLKILGAKCTPTLSDYITKGCYSHIYIYIYSHLIATVSVNFVSSLFQN